MTLSTRTCAGVTDEAACKVKQSAKHQLGQFLRFLGFFHHGQSDAAFDETT
jgi:hypothetical protein